MAASNFAAPGDVGACEACYATNNNAMDAIAGKFRVLRDGNYRSIVTGPRSSVVSSPGKFVRYIVDEGEVSVQPAVKFSRRIKSEF